MGCRRPLSATKRRAFKNLATVKLQGEGPASPTLAELTAWSIMGGELSKGVHSMVDALVAGSPKERRRYRRCSAEAKRAICPRSRAWGVSEAQVAQRHAVNGNLISKWLRDPPFA